MLLLPAMLSKGPPSRKKKKNSMIQKKPYCNFVPTRVAGNLGKPTQTSANWACVEFSSPPTLSVGILTLKVSTMASTWGGIN